VLFFDRAAERDISFVFVSNNPSVVHMGRVLVFEQRVRQSCGSEDERLSLGL
jgi:hypothetical protein